MNRLAIAGLIIAVAFVAQAGGNPDVRIYIDFDPPNRVHDCMPAAYQELSAYVCLGNLDSGLLGLSFGINDVQAEYPGVFASVTHWDLLPGNLSIGCDTGSLVTGCTFWSSECVSGPDVAAVELSLFYVGGSACIRITDHAWYPREVWDCNEPAGVDTYCVLAHGSIGGGACPEGDCLPVPVHSETWGTIKTLFR